jgi:RecJ-like exonuclease
MKCGNLKYEKEPNPCGRCVFFEQIVAGRIEGTCRVHLEITTSTTHVMYVASGKTCFQEKPKPPEAKRESCPQCGGKGMMDAWNYCRRCGGIGTVLEKRNES